jgi:Mlc titration factor MtfA (ptsG expression regulator)
MDVLFLLILSSIFFLVLYRIREKRIPIRSFFKGKYHGFIQYNPIPNDFELDELMLKHFAFYHVLSDPDRLQFRRKLNALLKSKWFKGRDGFEVSNDMMLLVVATMTQISLGIPAFTFPKFDRIVLFPKRFYSEIIQHDLKGLTIFKTGVVLISWPDYQQGYSEPTDKLNLGLHEMAHALFLDYFHFNKTSSLYSNWLKVAKPVLDSMKINQGPQFLRDYAKSNIHEFWAVCVEHFFEAPIQFRDQLPALYSAMCSILNQDMAQRILDYSASKKQKDIG